MELNLRHLRILYSTQIRRDVRQREIAIACGIHPTLYGRYESGKVRRPDLDNMEKIYKFYSENGLLVNGKPIERSDFLA